MIVNETARLHATIAEKLGYQVRSKVIPTKSGDELEAWDFLDPNVSIEKHKIPSIGEDGEIRITTRTISRTNKWKQVPAFSTNMSAAWKLVDYMRSQGFGVAVEVYPDNSSVVSGWNSNAGPVMSFSAEEDTPEHAICEAFFAFIRGQE